MFGRIINLVKHTFYSLIHNYYLLVIYTFSKTPLLSSSKKIVVDCGNEEILSNQRDKLNREFSQGTNFITYPSEGNRSIALDVRLSRFLFHRNEQSLFGDLGRYDNRGARNFSDKVGKVGSQPISPIKQAPE